MLDALGVSTRDEAVYRALLDRPHLDLDGVANHLGLQPSAVRDALDALVDLALVRITEEDTFRAVRPNSGLAALLAKAEAEIVVRQQQIEATRAAVAAIATTYDDSQRHAFRRLESVDAVRDRLVELAHSATSECLSFTPGGAQDPDTMAAEGSLNVIALQRGVSIRNLYLESYRNDPPTLGHARWMLQRGSLSRTVPALPMRLVIVDRKIALVPIDPAAPEAGALELHSPGVLIGFVALFEQLWATGTPIGDEPTRDSRGLSPQEQELLRLLARGHTDESAGRHLAISTRSVQRMMTNLTERLEATSRFQAGVEAMRRGWI